jgi:hypothetical protein
MKTILPGLLALLVAGLAFESGTANRMPPSPANATLSIAAAYDYDPPFGSPGWWEQQSDRGG